MEREKQPEPKKSKVKQKTKLIKPSPNELTEISGFRNASWTCASDNKINRSYPSFVW